MLASPASIRGLLAVGGGLTVLALAACGDDNKDKGSTNSGKSAGAQTMSVTLGADGKLTGVQPVDAGYVTVHFTNQAKGAYDLQLVKVDGNQTIDQVLKVTAGESGKPIPDWVHGAGGVGTTQPGKTATATQALDGGKYYALAEPDEDGKPITAPLTVNGGTASGALPAASGKVTAFEYGFKTQNLKSGKQQIEFANSGGELHHAVFLPLAKGATLAQAKRFLQTEKGKPPFDENRQSLNTAVLDGGKSEVIDANLQPGKYVLACFLTDRKGGPVHVAKGMITEVDVG